jgi:hypothetical protein
MMNEKSYSMGQVVYVALNKKNQVYPMQITEMIIKKTLAGEEIKYMLRAGSDSSTTISIDKIDGEIFESSEKARSTLIKRATLHVNKIVDAAISKSKEWYGQNDSGSEPESISDLPELNVRNKEDQIFENEIENEVEIKSVVLADGTVAKVRMPKI